MRSAGRRVFGLVLVVLLVVSVVGLAASQAFINKTGGTVTGITVEFSKSVMITKHDSVFPDQDPNGRSDQFTFSGGELHNYRRFNISWVPSSAKVTNYEWIKKTQTEQQEQTTPPARSDEQAFKLPDPNTPPILYGDDYPGPDEPLYQPKDDEQIWLTDLEGHEDIYDNDSIKINYAPGFDKSQITKINVSRNGVIMRFLPDTLDVLTNAQMKTFDGNPLEHSPASNHTDHAVMGYEYEFKIISADHLWIMKKTVRSGFRWRPKGIWAQIQENVASAGLDRLTHEQGVDYFQKLKQAGFTGVSLEMNYYVDGLHSSEIKTLYTSDNNIIPWNITTLTNTELEELLSQIAEAGLDARVMGMFYVSLKYGNEYKGAMDPQNPEMFFDNYAKLLEKIIPILNEYGVKSMTVLDETDTINIKYPSLISELLTRLSKGFNGNLAIDSGIHNIVMGLFVPVVSSWKEAIDTMRFWKWISSSGVALDIEYSCWAPEIETQGDQRSSVMAVKFVEFWKPVYDYVHLKYPGHSQNFGEIGVYNANGVGLGGASYWNMPNKKLDNQEMADIWYAYFKGSEELGVEKLDVWTIPFGDLWANDVAGNFFINIGLGQPESPAYRVIKAIIEPEQSRE